MITPQEYPSQASYDDDDGLGYYSDGVKRTLTDEQVAMFRHSEIQALLRERRHEKDNRDASEFNNMDLQTTRNVDRRNSSSAPGEDQEYARFLEREREQLTRDTVVKKRKRSCNADKSYNVTREDRKSARDLDGAVDNHDDLEYGDDAVGRSTSSYRSDEHSLQLERGRRRIVYEENDDVDAITSIADDQKARLSSERKAFLWPKIGV